MNNKQVGRFKVSAHFIKTDPDGVAAVFAMCKIVPVRCEMMFFSDVVEYTAISEKFAEVEDGCMVPEYTLTVSNGPDGEPFDVSVSIV